MEITGIPSGISGITNNPLWEQLNSTAALGNNRLLNTVGGMAEETGNVFDSMLRAMLGNVSETNEAIRTAQEFQLDVALGHSDDLLGLTLAIDRANSALNFTVQVTNRLLEAYREIMRMQV